MLPPLLRQGRAEEATPLPARSAPGPTSRHGPAALLAELDALHRNIVFPDTFEKIIPEDLAHNVGMMAAAVYYLAQMESPFIGDSE